MSPPDAFYEKNIILTAMAALETPFWRFTDRIAEVKCLELTGVVGPSVIAHGRVYEALSSSTRAEVTLLDLGIS